MVNCMTLPAPLVPWIRRIRSRLIANQESLASVVLTPPVLLTETVRIRIRNAATLWGVSTTVRHHQRAVVAAEVAVHAPEQLRQVMFVEAADDVARAAPPAEAAYKAEQMMFDASIPACQA